MATKFRRALVLVLAAVALVALVAFKILWAVTLWYEWIALAVGAACLLAIHVLTRGTSHGKSPSSANGDD